MNVNLDDTLKLEITRDLKLETLLAEHTPDKSKHKSYYTLRFTSSLFVHPLNFFISIPAHSHDRARDLARAARAYLKLPQWSLEYLVHIALDSPKE